MKQYESAGSHAEASVCDKKPKDTETKSIRRHAFLLEFEEGIRIDQLFEDADPDEDIFSSAQAFLDSDIVT